MSIEVSENNSTRRRLTQSGKSLMVQYINMRGKRENGTCAVLQFDARVFSNMLFALSPRQLSDTSR